MSGAGFHVHGPHDHELEHAVQHASQGHAAHDGVAGVGVAIGVLALLHI